MCIEPPFPLEVPVFLPYISAITYLGSVPNTKGCAWSRYAVMTRSVGRMASHAREHRFLSNVQVAETSEFLLDVELTASFLKLPHEVHFTEQRV